MKILGIDTTTKFLALGIFDGAKIYEYNLELGIKHSALLIPSIQRTLEAAGLPVSEIDYFACGLGPGSFTGMRVGLAAIKALSWAAKKPIIGISTLDILAQNVENNDINVMPIIDAKRKLIYTGIFKKKNGKLLRLKPYLLLTEKKLLEVIRPNSVILGDALTLYKESILKGIKGITFLEKDCWFPKGHNIIELAIARVKQKRVSNAFSIKPIYLYPKECQIKNYK